MMTAEQHEMILGPSLMKRIEDVSRDAYHAASADPESMVAMQALIEVYLDMIAIIITATCPIDERTSRAFTAANQLMLIVEGMKSGRRAA